MESASWLLLTIGLLGLFDIVYFHHYRCRLHERAESRREDLWHTLRHLIYGLQFLYVANLRCFGAATLALLVLYVADIAIAWADVLEEPESRARQGGLPRGEYFMHIVLSVGVGAYLTRVCEAALLDAQAATAVRLLPPAVPLAVRALLSAMGVGALAAFGLGLLRRRRAPRRQRIVVEAQIPSGVAHVWALTQEHDAHVKWDLRFTDITYEPGADARGFHPMRYATRLGFGVRVEGSGRYLSSRPPPAPTVLSTFEFDSADWKSLITKGRGVWQYTPRDGGTLFRTVFDYDVRHGCFGYWLDALLFRPLFRLATEWSFETLRQWCAGDAAAPARRSSRWRFALFLFARLLGRPAASGAAVSWA